MKSFEDAGAIAKAPRTAKRVTRTTTKSHKDNKLMSSFCLVTASWSTSIWPQKDLDMYTFSPLVEPFAAARMPNPRAE